jgi:hypothetical protein
MNNSIIIKIESGIVAEIYSSAPLEATIVDYDMIEGGETFEQRVKKAVISMVPEQLVKPEQIDSFTRTLVLKCRRPADDRQPSRPDSDVDATPLNTIDKKKPQQPLRAKSVVLTES